MAETKDSQSPGEGGVVSGQPRTAKAHPVGGHGGPPYGDLENEAFRRVGHCADQEQPPGCDPIGTTGVNKSAKRSQRFPICSGYVLILPTAPLPLNLPRNGNQRVSSMP